MLKFTYPFAFCILICCTPKHITIPQKTEAIVFAPKEYWSGITSERTVRKTGYQFKADSNTYKFYADLEYNMPPVYGEKYMITYDSLHPGWWEFDKYQCGPFFYPDEQVDTTIGRVYYASMVANKKVKMFWYLYNVEDSFFRKIVYCSDTALHKNVLQGRKFPVIYDPKNKGRAKMLFEPKGKFKEIPKRN